MSVEADACHALPIWRLQPGLQFKKANRRDQRWICTSCLFCLVRDRSTTCNTLLEICSYLQAPQCDWSTVALFVFLSFFFFFYCRSHNESGPNPLPPIWKFFRLSAMCELLRWPLTVTLDLQSEKKKLVSIETIWSRKRDCVIVCPMLEVINITWENIQIAKPKSVRCAVVASPQLIWAFRFADFLKWCSSNACWPWSLPNNITKPSCSLTWGSTPVIPVCVSGQFCNVASSQRQAAQRTWRQAELN